MRTLPPDFVGLMREHYGSASGDLLCRALMETEAEVSVRLNTRKFLPPSLAGMEPVLWCPDAYYLDRRPPFTFDPLLHAGAYYVQEASSMYVAALLESYGPKHACVTLDLCAAPGGKSTLLASLLPKGSMLLCNEPVAKRANILSENIQKWTRMPEGDYPVKTMVTNNYPAHFRAFGETFDLLLADVPCSGEGMFRKDPQAIVEWSMENVLRCVERQRDILQEIWEALKPGGLLIYSTCTFNRFEDEDNVRWICQELGAALLEERHFLPGRDRGEGFYCAAIRKDGQGDVDSITTLSVQERVQKKVLTTLKVLPQAFSCEGPRVELSYEDSLRYLRQEALRMDVPKGIVTLCYRGLPLGPGKSVAGRINNLYPDSWRIRTTYSNSWTLFPSEVAHPQ